MTREQRVCMGLRLKDIRLQRGVSIAALSERSGISTAHISNVEHGVRSVGLDALVDVVVALDVSLDYIVLGVHAHMMERGVYLRSDDELVETYLKV